MKWIVIGWILIVIGLIYPVLTLVALTITLVSDDFLLDVNWVLFTICCLIGIAGFMLKDKGMRDRAKKEL